MEDMKSLKCLDLRGTATKEVSSSVAYLISLEKLILRECAELTDVSSSIFELQHQRYLDLFWCESLVTFPTKSGSSTGLQDKHYDPLYVSLDSCTNLEEILEFPRDIDTLVVRCCSALKKISKLSNIVQGKESKMSRRTILLYCHASMQCQNLAQMKVSDVQDFVEEKALFSIFLSCQQSEFEVFYPAKRGVPDWFSFCSDADKGGFHAWLAYSFRIEFSGDFNWENKGLAFCAQSYISFKGPYVTSCTISINGLCIMEPSKNPEDRQWRLTLDHVWLYYIPFQTIIRLLSENGSALPSICLVKFEFESEGDIAVMGRCGIHVVMPEDEDGITIIQVDNADCDSEIHHIFESGRSTASNTFMNSLEFF